METPDWAVVTKICLFHDVGNIVKFDFDRYPRFLGDEVKNTAYWKCEQKEIIKKYGTDDHIATDKMLTEIGVERELIEIILNKSFGNSVSTKNSNNWPLKILYYGDLRVLPHRIGTIQERLNDVRERMPKYTNRPDFEELVDACVEIEKQIQENLDIPVSEINERNVTVDKSLLTNFEI